MQTQMFQVMVYSCFLRVLGCVKDIFVGNVNDILQHFCGIISVSLVSGL